MKNNKGFVLSTYVYMLLVFFLLMLTVMLSVLGNSKLLGNKMKEGLSKILGVNGGNISIILKGDKDDYTFLGSNYDDPGYTAQTTDGTSLTAEINSNLDTSKIGTYKIVYTVKKYGKTASVERNVEVVTGNFIYDYKNGEQEFIVPVTGYYRLEAWGAQGGYANSASYRGGYGGYSTGLAYLTKDTKLYINVGGKGTDAPKVAVEYAGGYNGGGTGKGTDSFKHAGGGGATHIAIKSGLLSTLETSIQDILIVAGGGGGAGFNTGSYSGYGGEGGGLIGSSGILIGNTDGETNVGIGGTQTSGAGFGIGASSTKGPGGGAGFYGGTSSDTYRGAGGGSGYVGSLLEAETLSSSNSANEIATSYQSKIGNGYAKITYVGEYNTPTITTIGDSLVFNKPTHYEVDITKSGYYQLEAWGAQGGYANSASYRGGYGAYSTGVAYLEEGTKLHVYVGGAGQDAPYLKQGVNGGYNGGGTSQAGNYYKSAGGGGATHIATESGLLSTLSTKKDKILIIAGGGGGAGYNTGSYYGYGADAGGIQGNNGTLGGYTDGSTSIGTGGTQTTGAGFGFGASSKTGAGGGSGLYGGTSPKEYRGAGGGSSYVENLISTSSLTKHTSCYDCKEITDENTRTIKVTTAQEEPTADTAKIGNGYARITLLYESEPIVTIGTGETKEFDYTGTYKIVEIKNSGYYRLEAWGAQGGYANSASYRGGYGGYSTGLAYLEKGTKLYVYVGGKGTDAPKVAVEYTGGYNGGGTGKGTDSFKHAGGGGATHIAVKSGLLSTLETSIQDILIVAGGGGGAGFNTGSYSGYGGEGGGLIGSSGILIGNTDGETNVGVGGTQTSGAGFGIGASSTKGPGGGAGFYGGTSSNTYRGAGGGSGYVGRLLEAETLSSSVSVNETATSYQSKIGNGYAKITYVGEYNTPTITTIGDSLVFEHATHYEVDITKSGYYQLEAWGAQGGYANSASYRGGYGAYSTGVAYLEEGTKLHVYVGGAGQDAPYLKQGVNGGYNGGGTSQAGNGYKSAGGGGATHIATESGLLSTLSTKKDKILIVAGGGGGAGYNKGSYYGYGADAGGIQGNNGTLGGYTDGSTSIGTGGTQTTGAGFGFGSSSKTGAGGGSGLYGGTSPKEYRGAGGGSSYIENLISTSSITKHMTCYGKDCKTSTDAGTLTNSVTVVSETPTADTAKIGNGYAKITLVS